MSNDDNKNKLALLQAKRNAHFERMQNIFELSKQDMNDETCRESFLNNVANLQSLRSEFQSVLDAFNTCSIKVDPNATISYQSWISFEELYCRVQRVVNLLKIEKSEIKETHKNNFPKLPRIDLVSFDGDIRNWSLFYNQFKRVVHDNTQLSDSERIHFLVSKLTGSAASLCAGIPPTPENYKILWNSLVDKYDDPRFLAASYLNQLLEFKPISAKSTTGLESFINTFDTAVRALKQVDLGNLTDFILLHLALQRLDSETVKLFEMSNRKKAMPCYDDLVEFVKEQDKIVRSSPIISKPQQDGQTKNISNSKPKSTKAFVAQKADNCIMCKSDKHDKLYFCSDFTKMTPQERFNFVKSNSLCINCLNHGHKVLSCPSKSVCRHCKSKHHSILHFGSSGSQNNASNLPAVASAPATSQQVDRTLSVSGVESSSPSNDNSTSVCGVARDFFDNRCLTTLLSTAKIKVFDKHNRVHFVRCLIDSGSQSDYITASCCKRLSLFVSNKNRFVEVQGIGGASQRILGLTKVLFTSRFDARTQYSSQSFVVDKITSQLPDAFIDVNALHYLDNLPLADDEYHSPGQIDMLLGVNSYCNILLFNKINPGNNLPTAIETSLGYILMGNAPTIISPQSTLSFCALTHEQINDSLQRFWQLEEVPSTIFISPEEQVCEDIYTSTTTRNIDGSYIVNLPFKENVDQLGNSFITAKRRYLFLERKFARSPGLREEYNAVITEYLNKKYLSLVPPENCLESGFYLPHHPVIRQDKSTTKLRIVLDASAKTDSGLSLNDVLHTGCNLQNDIFQILLKVRVFEFAFFADVRQMYLCIEVHPSHRSYQRILYRFSDDAPIETYQFNRVTFGLRSSPFLALRTMRQLAHDERDNFPHACSVLESDMYMDDLASSASSLKEAVGMASDLIQLLKRGGFELVKWTSNSLDLLGTIPDTHRQSESVSFDTDTSFKILGLQWLPSSDSFKFTVTPPNPEGTKRAILSVTARLYDILGLVGPVILYSKLLIKELWLLKLDWDDQPPEAVLRLWNQFISELPLISSLSFSRHLGVDSHSRLYLLAFSDASEKAYGCVVYTYVLNNNQKPIVRLLCSKSKVAPVKTVTLARLELCGILLMAKLLRVAYDTISKRHPIEDVYAFSDSQVALCWVHSSPHRFNTFVANRIAQCQTYFSSHYFRFIPGSQNPADCLSRGLLPSQLVQHELWLTGPPWASLPIDDWPVSEFSLTSTPMPEEKSAVFALKNKPEHILITLSLKFSNWDKFLRCVVYMLRFIKKLPRNNCITASDLDFAELTIVKAVQHTYFYEDIDKLKNSKLCSHALRKLSPFLDQGILRVGGRLANSSLDYSQKHPILLPRNGHIIELIIDAYHVKHFHTGPNLLLSILRQRFWILSARRIVRMRTHRCNICFRLNPKPTFPVMSDLPECRVEQSKAFSHTGVDFAGPFNVTFSRKRGVRSQKAYLCLFICLVTKAVHLELASSLSSASFLDAFKRFLSRRGPCQCIYSDNGTNFVASKAYLSELNTFLRSEEYFKTFTHELTNNRIAWKLNPPSAPHFGGIWESNIKCVKSHLFKVIGTQILTYEELNTILIQIEAILNSRPLYQLSSDPSEPSALTPAHFLSLAPLSLLPAADLNNERANLLTRFSLLDSLVQSFWNRFKSEYLHNLQCREKWNTSANPVLVGTVVLLNMENAPPLQWPLGVVTKLFPGRDGVTRVVEVRIKSGVLKRPIVKLCPLPNQ